MNSSADAARRTIELVRRSAGRAAVLLRERRDDAAATAGAKADRTVVTALDYEVQRLYVEALFAEPALRGHLYVIGEENFAAAGIGAALIEQNRRAFGHAELVVAIDPLDNTRGYVDGETEKYATVAAVLHRGMPVFHIAIAPEAGEHYEGDITGATFNGRRPPPFCAPLAVTPRLLAAGFHWLKPPDPLGPALPSRFDVTERFGSLQLAIARMVRRDPDLPSFDGVITSGAPCHETIPGAAVLQLAGADTVRPDGRDFFPIPWADLSAARALQLIGGCTEVVQVARQMRAEHPLPPG